MPVRDVLPNYCELDAQAEVQNGIDWGEHLPILHLVPTCIADEQLHAVKAAMLDTKIPTYGNT
eukprot:6174660-Pleurochrysis_carterae.AAC.3